MILCVDVCVHEETEQAGGARKHCGGPANPKQGGEIGERSEIEKEEGTTKETSSRSREEESAGGGTILQRIGPSDCWCLQCGLRQCAITHSFVYKYAFSLCARAT